MSTKSTLKKLDQGGNWMDAIDQFFTNAAHIPVSSIGTDVRILDLKLQDASGERKVKRIVTPEQYDKYTALPNGKEKYALAKKICESAVPVDDVHPRFLELPILTFLMKFNMIPAMDNETYNIQPDYNFDLWLHSCAMTFNEKEGAMSQEYPEYVEKVKKASVFSRLFGGGSKK